MNKRRSILICTKSRMNKTFRTKGFPSLRRSWYPRIKSILLRTTRRTPSTKTVTNLWRACWRTSRTKPVRRSMKCSLPGSSDKLHSVVLRKLFDYWFNPYSTKESTLILQTPLNFLLKFEFKSGCSLILFLINFIIKHNTNFLTTLTIT